MINIFNNFQKQSIRSKIILQIHDELLFEVKNNELDEVIKIVKKEMETEIQFTVPIKVDYNYGLNWEEAH